MPIYRVRCGKKAAEELNYYYVLRYIKIFRNPAVNLQKCYFTHSITISFSKVVY